MPAFLVAGPRHFPDIPKPRIRSSALFHVARLGIGDTLVFGIA